ncbi:hypothetical protein ABVF61_01250 [Roseibium sp. HPY-6]|uniref:hypothetical protein n=1 Tax=Roseibium sp. HPY-6 TaxID=3229852 RepID=UPI003390043C
MRRTISGNLSLRKLWVGAIAALVCLLSSATAHAITYSEKLQGDLDALYSLSLPLSDGLNTISGTAGMWRYLSGEVDIDHDTINFSAAPDTVINSAFITVSAIRQAGFVKEGWGRAHVQSVESGDEEQMRFDLLTPAPGYYYNSGIPIDLPATFELPVGAALSNAQNLGLPLDFNLFLRGDGSGDFKFSSVIFYDYQVEINATLKSPTPVPLPAALPLLGCALGLLGLAGWRRGKRAAL